MPSAGEPSHAERAGFRLIYVADPMCAWCWGFAPALAEVRGALGADVGFELVLGGLAPDDEQPMPEELRRYIQSAWDAVEARTGVRFNRDFWTACAPRRSTWPACRAVLAAERLAAGAGWPVFQALQRAYYLEARNPSERETLAAVFTETVRGGPGAEAFLETLDGPEVRAELDAHFRRRDALEAHAFPTLLVQHGEQVASLARGYASAAELRGQLTALGLTPAS
ncbi:MAG: DsbA family protein [Planctomycetota bacterium]